MQKSSGSGRARKRGVPDWYKHELELLKHAKSDEDKDLAKLDLAKIPEAPVEFNDLYVKPEKMMDLAWKHAKKAFIASGKEENRVILTMRLDGWNALECPFTCYEDDINAHAVVFYQRVPPSNAVLVYPVVFAKPKCSGRNSSDFAVSYKEAHAMLKKRFPQSEAFVVTSFIKEEAWYASLDISCNRVGDYMYKISAPCDDLLDFTDKRFRNPAAIWNNYMIEHGQG